MGRRCRRDDRARRRAAGSRLGAAGLLDRWWQGVTGADAKSAAAPPAAPAAIAQTQAPAAPTIPVVRPKVQTVSETLEITGNAAAVNQVKLIARVVGFLEQIHFQDGALVRKGDLLFTIQQDQYKAQLQQAQARFSCSRRRCSTRRPRWAAIPRCSSRTPPPRSMSITGISSERARRRTSSRPRRRSRWPSSTSAIPRSGRRSTARWGSTSSMSATWSAETGRKPLWRTSPSSIRSMSWPISARNRHCRSAPTWTSDGSRWRSCIRCRSRPRCRMKPDFPIAARSNTSRRRSIRRPARCWCAASCGIPNRTLLPGMFVKIRLPMGKTVKSALLVPDRALQEDQGGRYLLVVEQDDVIRQRYVQLGELSRQSAGHHQRPEAGRPGGGRRALARDARARRWCRN